MPVKPSHRGLSRWVIALLFSFAGIMHFVSPGPYVGIVPPFLPFPFVLVWVSGAAEILGGIGVLVPQVRRAAGWGLIALLIAVFPANIYMFWRQLHEHGWVSFTVILLVRLPLQILLIAWVFRSAISDETAVIEKK